MLENCYYRLSSVHSWIQSQALQEVINGWCIPSSDKIGKRLSTSKVFVLTLISIPVGITSAVANLAAAIFLLIGYLVPGGTDRVKPLINRALSYGTNDASCVQRSVVEIFIQASNLIFGERFSSDLPALKTDKLKKIILARDQLQRLQTSSIPTDYEFEVAGKSVKFHSIVMDSLGGNQGGYLDSCFEEGLKKKYPLDLSWNAFLAFYRYLYTGFGIMNTQVAKELIIFASKNQFNRLEKQCQAVLETHMNTENLPELVEMAETYFLYNLKASCLRYLARNGLLSGNPEREKEYCALSATIKKGVDFLIPFKQTLHPFSRKNPDLTLVCRGGVQVRAHKLVLSLFSQDFASLIKPSSEALDFPEIPADRMGFFLDFVYERKFPEIETSEDLERWVAIHYLLPPHADDLPCAFQSKSAPRNRFLQAFRKMATAKLGKIQLIDERSIDGPAQRTASQEADLQLLFEIQKVAHLLADDETVTTCLKKRSGLTLASEIQAKGLEILIDEYASYLRTFCLGFCNSQDLYFKFSLDDVQRKKMYQLLGSTCIHLNSLVVFKAINEEEIASIFETIPQLKHLYVQDEEGRILDFYRNRFGVFIRIEITYY